jgi:signal transduction histidine kinase
VQGSTTPLSALALAWAQPLASPLASMSAVATAFACIGIAVALAMLARHHRSRGLSWLLGLVATFMLVLGLAHPLLSSDFAASRPWVATAVAAVTALLGVASAAALWTALPAALRAIGPSALEAINQRLHAEIRERERAEDEVRRANAALEARVAERTRELERSNRELEQFAYVASHDLREPLRMVTSYTDLLARRYRGKLDATADEFIAYALEGCQRMRQLIVDLLEYSRVDRQRSPQLIDVEEAFAVACHDLAVPIARAGAIITHDRLPKVHCTPSQLVQVLENLLRNAMIYRAERTTVVHVGVRDEDDDVVVFVRDNGIGFDMRHADRIFGMFQRLHVRGEYPGTGMGLAMCKKIMEAHGGRIWAEAEPGVGATFLCAFPKVPPA